MSSDAIWWRGFVDGLPTRVCAGELTMYQTRTLVGLVHGAMAILPYLRYPSVSRIDGVLHVSWTYTDTRHSLTVDIEQNGSSEWFYRDGEGYIDGGDLPPDVPLCTAIIFSLRSFAASGCESPLSLAEEWMLLASARQGRV